GDAGHRARLGAARLAARRPRPSRHRRRRSRGPRARARAATPARLDCRAGGLVDHLPHLARGASPMPFLLRVRADPADIDRLGHVSNLVYLKVKSLFELEPDEPDHDRTIE